MTTTKRLFIKSKSDSETDNTEIIEFNEPLINVTEIKFNSIHLHNSYHNASKSLKNAAVTFTTVLSTRKEETRNDTRFPFADGYYTIKDLENEFNYWLESDFMPEDVRGKIKLKFYYQSSTNYVRITRKVHEEIKATLSDFRLTCKALEMLGLNNTELVPIDQIDTESEYGVKIDPITNYYVHCDLIQRKNNLFRNIKGYCTESDILCILPVDTSKRWWDTVTYNNLNCIFKPNKKEINSLTLWISDEDGNHIDFNGYPILYELEVLFEDKSKEQDQDWDVISNQRLERDWDDNDEELDCY